MNKENNLEQNENKNNNIYIVNNLEENDNLKIDAELNKNEIIDNYNNNQFQDQFTIIERTLLGQDNLIETNIEKNETKNNDENNYNDEIFTNYITDTKNQILCTKRDLILKNLAYFFYEEYFIDKNFSKLKRQFLYLYPPKEEKNNYNNLEKFMTLKYPSTIKNFSNSEIFYPRIFFRPDKNFFKNEYFMVGHDYFRNNIDFYKPNFEYGHGLLNQKNFDLFEINNTNEDDENENITKKNFGLDESTPCYETEYCCFNNNMQGFIVLKEKYIIYQTNMDFDLKKYTQEIKYILTSKQEEMIQAPKQIIIPYKLIKQIIKRKFIFFEQALEIFLHNGKSYFFNLYREEICKKFFDDLENINNNKNNDYNFEIIKEPCDYFYKKKYTSNWLDKKLSTLEYLLLINKFSGRTYNDLSQYLVLPWTLKDYFDINDKKNIRDFSLAMSVQEEECLEIVKEYYDLDNEEYKSYFKCHYSNSSYIAIYLFRINPFTNNQIKLQSGRFDAPNRQINSLQDICSIFKEHKETCELIPEYYYLIESFLNVNFNFYGFLNKKKQNIVNNIKLEKDFDSLLELLLFHQNFLNSEEISSNLHKWIDNIYGENQITNKKNIINSYPFECYEQNVKKKVINQIK